MTHYKPYSPEWHRRRELQQAIFSYLDAGEFPDVVVADIMEILHDRSESAYKEFSKVSELENKLHLSK